MSSLYSNSNNCSYSSVYYNERYYVYSGNKINRLCNLRAKLGEIIVIYNGIFDSYTENEVSYYDVYKKKEIFKTKTSKYPKKIASVSFYYYNEKEKKIIPLNHLNTFYLSEKEFFSNFSKIDIDKISTYLRMKKMKKIFN